MNKILQLKEDDYQTILGVTKHTFDCMLKFLEQAYAEKHKKGVGVYQNYRCQISW